MPDGRFLSKTVATDEPLNRLTWQAQAVYMMTVPHLDRDGLITGHPLLLMAQVAPLRAAELVTIMPALIQEWVAEELVILYQSDDQPALFFPGFPKHQRLPHYDRETPSRFAPPPGYVRTAAGLEEQPAAPAQPSDPVPAAPVPADSGATPDQLQTSSGPTPPIKQQSSKESKSLRSPHEKSSSSSTARTRARPSPPAAPAARSSGKVKPEIYQALKDFGVAEPALSELSSNGVTPDLVDGWIAYLATQTKMQRPVGYLVTRLRAHEPPPELPEGHDEDPDSYEALKRRYVPAGYEDIIHV